MAERLYLDHNATSPLRPHVRDAMMTAYDEGFNPSSVHAEGRRAKARLEAARKTVSDVMGVSKEGIVFTGSGTEADNLALWGLVHGEAKVRRLFVSAIEHDAMKAPAQSLVPFGVVVEEIPVTAQGVIDLSWLEARLAEYDPQADGPFAVVVMLANNETGVLQPIDQLGPMVWPKGGFVVVDAVQAVGKVPVHFDASGADIMTIGAHKIGGPVGVGAVLMKSGIPLSPMVRGGGQEQYRRAGTENVAAIIGLATVLERASPTDYAELAEMRNEIEAGLPSEARVWGQEAARLPNTLCFSVDGFASETQVMVMDLGGIAVSSGAACSSGKVRKSAVLSAMGATDAEAQTALRVSLGWNTPKDSAQMFLSVWLNEFERTRQREMVG